MPKVYGIEHFLYLFVWIIIFIVSLYYIKKKVKDERKLSYIIKAVGGLLLFAIVWNRISIAYVDKNPLKLIPDSFCGTSSLIFALTILLGKKDNIWLHCVAYFGVVGGLLTIGYPDFIGQAPSIFYCKTISGLLHHTLMIYLFILIVITGYFKPTYKKWYAVVLGGACYMTYGLFLIKAIGLNDAMVIERPLLDGTIFYWYVVGPLFLLIYTIFITIWELIKVKRKKEAD